MESIKKSSFSGLVDYISSSKDNEHRIENIQVTNFPDDTLCADQRETALAAGEFGDFTQDQNTRSKDDKTYHLLVSFRAGEHPSTQVLKEIEQAYADALGFSEHQRVSAVHSDTDNLHIHIAFNKIHPKNFTIKTPKNDNWIRDQLTQQLEEKYNLQRDNHIKDKQKTKTQSQSKAADMEAHSGQESFLSWMDENLKEGLKHSKSWDDFHKLLEDHGVELKKRGNGFIFEAESGVRLKASSLDREFSKTRLERKLGAFVEPIRATDEQSDEQSLDQEQQKPPEEQAQQTQGAGVNSQSKNQNSNKNSASPGTTPDPQQQQTAGAQSSASQSTSKAKTAPKKPKKTYQKKPISPATDKDAAALFAAFSAEKQEIKAKQDALLANHLANIENLKKKSARWREALDKQIQKEFQEIYQESNEKMKEAGLTRETWTQWKERKVSENNQEVMDALTSKKTSGIYEAYQKERQSIFEKREFLKAEKAEWIEKQKERGSKLREALKIKNKQEFKALGEDYKTKKALTGDLTLKYADWLKKEAQSGNEKAQASILASERSKKAEKLLPIWKQQSATYKKEKTALFTEQKERIAKVVAENKATRAILKNMKVKGGKKKDYELLFKKQTKQIEEIRSEIKGRIEALGDGGLSWADWLKKEAKAGNEDALEVMRGKSASLIKRAEKYAADPAIKSMSASALTGRKDVEVTKSGTLLFKLWRERIEDDGKNLSFSEKSSDDVLLFALTAAAKRDGNVLNLTGKKSFQERIVKLVAKEGLEVSFSDKRLEKLREKEIQKGKENGSRKDTRRTHGGIGSCNRGRGARAGNANRGTGKSGRTARSRRSGARGTVRSFADRIQQYAFAFYFQHRVNISEFSFGEGWETSAQAVNRNSVRNVPLRGMASHQKPENTRDNRTAVSLPVFQDGRLGGEKGRAKIHNGLRGESALDQNVATATAGGRILKQKSEVSNANEELLAANNLKATVPQKPEQKKSSVSPKVASLLAVNKYIQERQEKRARGIIQESFEALKEKTGSFIFDGIRRVDEQAMALLKGKEKETVWVLAVDKNTENRLRQIKKGQKIEVQKGQKIITRPQKKKDKSRNEGR